MADDGSAQKALKGQPPAPVKDEKPRVVLLNGEPVGKQEEKEKK